MKPLTPPFPYFGSKKRIATTVWEALGDTSLYIEPFGGSLAVLLARTEVNGNEVVNDANMFIPNFWRALRADPAGLLEVAAQPVTEVDYKARHRWLVTVGAETLERIGVGIDPDTYDLKVAGWWVWGQRASIARWCVPGSVNEDGSFAGVVNQRPTLDQSADFLGDDWDSFFAALSQRLVRVRVLCGGWERCVTPGLMFRNERTGKRPVGVFLDPPYRAELRNDRLYGVKSELVDPLVVNDQIQEWCRQNESDERLRIVLAGLEGEYDLPGWRQIEWRAPSASERNRDAERLWLSPSCLAPSRSLQGDLFGLLPL